MDYNIKRQSDGRFSMSFYIFLIESAESPLEAACGLHELWVLTQDMQISQERVHKVKSGDYRQRDVASSEPK